MSRLIYLASPYSHLDPVTRERRYLETLAYTAKTIKLGLVVFSPIVYGRHMEDQIGTDFGPWQKLNDTMIAASLQVWVLCLSGWRDSIGVQHECNLAADLGIPIEFIQP